MKREEKTGLSKERILQAAVQEFGSNGYDASALNTICAENGISKGLIYHYFADKDDLYLACVARCFDKVIEYLKEQGVPYDLENYMRIRFQYFEEHPHHARIFFETMLQPPNALREQIAELRKDFDLFNREIYQEALSKVKLREGVKKDDAVDYFQLMQEMFNGYYSSSAYAGKNLKTLAAEHEDRLSKTLDFMLFGLIERRTEK